MKKNLVLVIMITMFLLGYNNKNYAQVHEPNIKVRQPLNTTTVRNEPQLDDATLSELKLSYEDYTGKGGSGAKPVFFSPNFSRETIDYTASIKTKYRPALFVTAKSAQEKAKVQIAIDGKIVDYKKANTYYYLENDENTVTITVTAPDGKVTKTYTIDIALVK